MSNKLLILFIATLLFSCQKKPQLIQELRTNRTPIEDIYPFVKTLPQGIEAKNGMVVTAHPLASKIGVQVLKAGGNAYDAAVAVHFALAVAYPRAGNIGGGGFAVLRNSDGKSFALDFREKAPLKASTDMYLDKEGNPIDKLSQTGYLSVGVPGSVDGMLALHQKHGSLSWEKLLQPAIDLAEKGIILTENEAKKLNDYQEDFIKWSKNSVFVHPQKIWNAKDLIKQEELAQTLRRIQKQKRKGFYKGKTAELLLNQIKIGNGIITQDDLDQYQAVWRDVVEQKFSVKKGDSEEIYTMISMPPPSSGGIALAQLLQGASEFLNEKNYKHNSSNTIHILTELERRVYADRATHLGDPDFYEVPQKMLLQSSYNTERNKSISLSQKTPSEQIKEGKVSVIESMETTHFSITDKDGNAISVTTTLNSNYGSKIMIDGAGFFLNNEMDDFSVKAGFPNQFGLVGAEANKIEPQKRMLSSMTPTIVEKYNKNTGKDELFMVVGTPGGSTIITTNFQVILNTTFFGMPIQEAVNAKKVHHQWLPDEVYYEELPDSVKNNLVKRGHQLKKVAQLGKVEAILVSEKETYIGAADYTRGDDTALGY